MFNKHLCRIQQQQQNYCCLFWISSFKRLVRFVYNPKKLLIGLLQIGSTGRELKHRLADHRGYIQNQVTSRATGAHWNLPGHSLADLRVSVLEQCKKNSEEYRLEREKYFIRKFDTYNSGINREW